MNSSYKMKVGALINAPNERLSAWMELNMFIAA